MYWIGFVDNVPYAFILSDILKKEQTDLSQTHILNMSQTGHTISLDFGIGNKEYLGRELGTPTLSALMSFYKSTVDPKSATFFIDPDQNNPRAIRIYNKVGFTKIGQYKSTQGAFIGQNSDLMVRKI